MEEGREGGLGMQHHSPPLQDWQEPDFLKQSCRVHRRGTRQRQQHLRKVKWVRLSERGLQIQWHVKQVNCDSPSPQNAINIHSEKHVCTRKPSKHVWQSSRLFTYNFMRQKLSVACEDEETVQKNGLRLYRPYRNKPPDWLSLVPAGVFQGSTATQWA